jgi:hypothetical protein
MPKQKEGKKGRKIGRNKRKPSKVRYTAKAGLLKRRRPIQKGSNSRKVEPGGFCLDTVDARMPEKFLPPAFRPLHPRPHVGNELMELAAHAPDSARSQDNRLTAESVTAPLNVRARPSALAVQKSTT